jgi:uncharacterized protein
MLNLSLTAVMKGEVRVKGEVLRDDPLFEGLALKLASPLSLELEARPVGEGVLVRGRMEGELEMECRRCVTAVRLGLDEPLDLLYEPLSAEEEEELSGEVFPLPPRGDDLDLRPALREQILLRVPEYVECSETCRGLCPQCGTNLNEGSCDCVAEEPGSPWDALKKLKFD